MSTADDADDLAGALRRMDGILDELARLLTGEPPQPTGPNDHAARLRYAAWQARQAAAALRCRVEASGGWPRRRSHQRRPA